MIRIRLSQLKTLVREQVEDGGDDNDPSVDDADEKRLARWQDRRPDVGHLKDAVSGTGAQAVPLFKVGDRVVVEKRTGMLKGSPWLETVVGRVKSINMETGAVAIVDEESDPRAPRLKHASFTDGMHVFKFASVKGSAFAASPAPRPSQQAPVGDTVASVGGAKKQYRIYGKLKGAAAHTRLKGKAYLAPADTRFKAGDQADVAPEDGRLRVKADDRSQLWEPEGD